MIADRYDLVRTLGQGAFGHTSLARDMRDDRMVAIKMLDTRNADWKAHELFEREAAVLRSLRHHGVPEVYEALRGPWGEGGTEASFLVMEYVEGTSLAQMIGDGRHLDTGEVLHVLVELLGVLDYLHGRAPPILHRDIKPANIIVRPTGFPALVDFGSVRRVFAAPEESGSTIAGTYGYMPYEQYMGQATPSSDLYAVGATMLHILTGRPPRDFMTAEGRIEVPATLAGDSRLHAVIARMLRPSPSERFASAREARQALITSDSVALAVPQPRAVATRALAPIELPPAPRTLDGVTRTYYDRVAHSAWELMSASTKPSPTVSASGLVSVVFFSVVTAGVLPLVYWNLAHDRRRRLKVFFKEGIQTTAEILAMELAPLPFEERITNVSYEFEADGQLWRDADTVLPIITHRWKVGDRIHILYIPRLDYDSVIISSS